MRTLALSLVALVPLAAAAEDPAAPAVQWKAQAKAGLVSTGGNAQTTTLTAGATASRSDPSNKLLVEGVVAYGQSGVLVVRGDANGNGLTDDAEIARETRTTANAWTVRARYDRFFLGRHGVFVGGSIGADVPAGKDVIGSGQAGWAAKLLRTASTELVAELGYDFSYEDYAAPAVNPNEIHSARGFVGETVKLNEAVGLVASIEALANLNDEKAPNARTPGAKVEPFDDLRVNGRVALTAALRKNVSLSVGFALRWDRNPAPLPPISGAPPLAPGLFAKETDTVTDAALIVTFL